MRILVYGINYAPELTGIGKYTAEMCVWLAGRGHDVRVVTAPPYYPEWRLHKGYCAGAYRRESVAGVRIDRCPLWVPVNPSGVKRILHLASFALSSLPLLLRAVLWRPQVILVVEPPLFCAPAAWLTARLSGAKAWLHVQDLEVDAAFDLGLVPRAFQRVVFFLERLLVRRFDGVSTVSQAMRSRLLRKGVTDARCHLFQNWADCKAIYPLLRTSRFREHLNFSDGAFVALYSGNMGEKQGLELVVEAARELRAEPDMYFVLCGDGAARGRIESLAAGIPNIRWLPLQPVDRLNELLNLADVHLLPQRAEAADLVMPSKLTGILASGRPVIAAASVDSELAQVAGEAGLVVPPGAPYALVTALLQMKNDPELRAVKGRRSRRYAEQHFAIDAVLERFEIALQQCVNGEA